MPPFRVEVYRRADFRYGIGAASSPATAAASLSSASAAVVGEPDQSAGVAGEYGTLDAQAVQSGISEPQAAPS